MGQVRAGFDHNDQVLIADEGESRLIRPLADGDHNVVGRPPKVDGVQPVVPGR